MATFVLLHKFLQYTNIFVNDPCHCLAPAPKAQQFIHYFTKTRKVIAIYTIVTSDFKGVTCCLCISYNTGKSALPDIYA